MKFCKNCIHYTHVIERNMVTGVEEGSSHQCAAAAGAECDVMRRSQCGPHATLYVHNPASFDHADLIPPEKANAK